MSKTLLFVSAGLEALPAIKLAKSMGLHVVASDANPNALGFAFADDTLIASTYDIEETVAAASRYHKDIRPIDGAICVASDVPLTVANVAAALDLPGISIASATLATDKLAMKQRFANDGVPIPWFSAVDSVDQLQSIVAIEGLPLVIKPVDSRGSRGVLRLQPETNLEWAFETAKAHSPTKRVMVERFLSGPQVSTESMVIDGVAYTPGFADRNYELLDHYAPNIIENGGELPSKLDDVTQQAVHDLIQSATHSIGIRNGVIKGDVVVTDGKPHVIEVAARLSGGYFCTHEIPLNTGIDFVGSAIRQALGESVSPIDLEPRFNVPVVQRYFFPEPGEVTAIKGLDAFVNNPDVAYLDVWVKKGEIIRPVDSHPGRAGVVIATGEKREDAIALAEMVVSEVTIQTKL